MLQADTIRVGIVIYPAAEQKRTQAD